jgi:branched-chain amino acid transport system substrate-binding protein
MSKPRSARFFAALCIAAASLTGALGGPARAADPYEIPVMLSLTGNFAFIGKQEVESLQVIEKAVNKTGGIRGRPIHFAVTDVQSSPVVTLQVATPILNKRPAIVVGPDSTAQTNALLPLLASHQTVVYSMSVAFLPPPGSDVFVVGIGNFDLYTSAVRYLRQKGITRLGVISTTDASGVDQLQQIERVVALPENRGVSLVAREAFAITDLTATAQTTRLKAADPQAVLIATTGTAFGTALHAITDLNWDIPVMTNAGNINRAQIAQYASFLPKTLLFTGMRYMGFDVARPGPVRDAQKLFYQSLREGGIAKPDFGNSACWDAASVIVSALRKLGPDATGPQIHEYIENLHDFAGINGILDFRNGNQRGLGVNAAMIVQWDPKKVDWVPVSTFGGNPLKP